MTFDEAKATLQELKGAKRRVRAIHEQLADLISIKGSLNVTEGRTKGSFHSPVEHAVERIEAHKAKLAEALEKAFALEDKLADAIETLTPIEQDIIIGNYMRNRTHEQLAQEIGYTERNIMNIKRKAIRKISDKI